MTAEVTSLAEYADNGKMRTPLQTLENAIELHKDELADSNKILILSLEHKDGAYNAAWINGGMTVAECITLIEVAKTQLLTEMGYL